MWEKVLSTVAAVAIPSLGLVLQASRRNRLRRRIEEYLGLVEQWKPHNAGVAGEFQRAAEEVAHLLILRDERALRRKIDPAAVVTILFLTVPAVAVIVWAWTTWDTNWKWVVIPFATVWALVWAGAGVTQLFAERTEELKAVGATADT